MTTLTGVLTGFPKSGLSVRLTLALSKGNLQILSSPDLDNLQWRLQEEYASFLALNNKLDSTWRFSDLPKNLFDDWRIPQFESISILQPYRILLDYFRKEIFSLEGKGGGEDAGFVNESGF